MPEHEKARQAFYRTIPRFWHDLFQEPYALYDANILSDLEAQNIRQAAERITAIYDKAAPLLRSLPDETLLELGYPEQTLPFLRLKPLDTEGVIRRVDLVKTEQGYKHYELNADTPTFIYELFRVNGIAARHFGLKDVNEGCEENLQNAIRTAVRKLWPHHKAPKVVFTAHHDHEEDWNTAFYLGELFGYPHEIIPLQELKLIEDDGLYTPAGTRIDVLYRQTYPIEHLVDDKDEDGTAVGVELLKLVADGKLAMLQPMSAFLLQSKAVQALIWGLHTEKHDYFTAEEHRWIEDHFLPTYLDREPFLNGSLPFVEKPAFGREGDTITIFHSDGTPLKENSLRTYGDSLKIYQAYQELPSAAIQTPYGQEEAHLLIGAFVIGRHAEAFGIRAGSAITGNEAYFLPAGLQP
ncbi:glutathionylspermidine synthase family protein [Bacillus mangrovi]|uniref:Glutathionylspermidine synthase family protein n=1 Tax=Metabacillus mangrovi TaxID=1491830 RepID=A0A7X2S6I9_9BACI|nr:glutathionylspermidine synthase family protein [Metabacillus mangrovi]MTH54573.1 glutathionylspermidine synthase family protein [Metabacillus mangrovi]